MATIAPWLVPPNFLGAMEAGTQAGLAKRRIGDEETQFAQRAAQESQDEQAREDDAAARLKLSYDSLAQQHDLSQQEIAARAAQAQAAQALRQQSADSLEAWRLNQAQVQNERLRIAAANALKTPVATEPQIKTFDDGTSVIYNPKGGGFKMVTPQGQQKPMTAAEELKLVGLTDDPDLKKALMDDLKKKAMPTASPSAKSGADTNAPFILGSPFNSPDYGKLMLNSATNSPDRTAQGGYKINATYKGGLKYLGGDPNDQSSWQMPETNAPANPSDTQ